MTDSINRSAGPASVSDDRRTLLRLRDLCDEVLASHRIAADRDLFSDDDRLEVRLIAPTLQR